MAKHIGIVACSAEGAALCYRTFCNEAGQLMGKYDHPEVSMHTHSLAEYITAADAGDWPQVAKLMLDSAAKLAQAGVELLICPDNTIHQAMGIVEKGSPLPWLHIAREVVAEAKRRGLRRLAIMGTMHLMTGPVYREAAEAEDIETAAPDQRDRDEIDRIIFDELVNGMIKSESRTFFNSVMQRMKDRGCDGAVLGCTEIPLIVDPAEAPFPTLDSTRILARAAIRQATQQWLGGRR